MSHKPIYISHSGKDCYSLCSMKYKLKYIDKLVSPSISSPLFFGSALDVAFSRLLLEKKKTLTEEEQKLMGQTAEELFYKNMLETVHNKETVSLPKNVNCEYSFKDFTPELLTEQHLPLLEEIAPDMLVSANPILGFIEFVEDCKAVVKSKKKLHTEDKLLLNYMTWLTLVEKGYLMVEAYRQQIMPEIEEVFEIQKRVEIKNATGDVIPGYIDFTASFTAEPGVRYVCDNKSSSTAYKSDSVATSEQLSTYCEAEGTDKAAYVVVRKEYFKKPPYIRTQIIKDTIPEVTFCSTFDKFEETVHNITAEKFECNWNSCYSFGRQCEYYRLCKFGSSEGLKKQEASPKKVKDDNSEV